jgi:hypothetical protein
MPKQNREQNFNYIAFYISIYGVDLKKVVTKIYSPRLVNINLIVNIENVYYTIFITVMSLHKTVLLCLKCNLTVVPEYGNQTFYRFFS